MADTEIPLAPVYSEPAGKPKDIVGTSYGQALAAQTRKIVAAPINQFNYFTSNKPYDPDSIDRIETHIENNDLYAQDAQYLRSYGLGSEENFVAALDYIARKNRDKEAMNNASTLTAFVSDPLLPITIATPYVAVNLSRATGFALAKGGFKGGLEQVARANQLLTGKKYTAKEITKIATLDAAVTSGTYNMSTALTDIGVNPDDVDDIMFSAALSTLADTTISSAFGYGIGKYIERPQNGKVRVKNFSTKYKQYLNSVNSKPAKDGTELSYAGKWFNESWFSKLLPSPIKATVVDKDIPDKYTEEMLLLGGSNGLPFVANQMGKSVGNSVNINAGRRQGEWYKAMDTVDKNYRAVSPRGAPELFNVNIAGVIESVRKRIGMTSYSPADWQEHIGKLIMDDVPYSKVTPNEAEAMQAVRGYFEPYGKELTDIGLINTRDIFEESYNKDIGRAFEVISVTNKIIDQNKKWMTSEISDMQGIIDKQTKIRQSLIAQQTNRGLTSKQIKLKSDVEITIKNYQDQIDNFNKQFDLINNAKSIEELQLAHSKLNLTKKMEKGLADLNVAINDIRAKIDNAAEIIKYNDKKTTKTKYDLPRIFNRQKIHKDREGFRNALMAAYKKDPTVISKDAKGMYVVQKLAIDPDSLYRRAEETIENIMEETEEDALDAIFTGYGRSGPLVSRRLSIPNSAIKDYLVTDVKELMINYGARVAPKLEYHKANLNPDNGKLMTFEEKLTRLRKDMEKDNVPPKKIDKFIKNYVHTYDRVVGSVLKRPDAWDTKTADMLRSATSWTFLGGSGVAAFGDAASIFMDHELNVIGRTVIGLADDVSWGMGARELRLAGEGLEMKLGTSHLRYMENLSNNMFSKSVPDKLNNAFFVANGLAPVTIGMKVLDSIARGHTIIEASIRLSKNQANDFEKEFLARYNITPAMAKRISKMPWEKSKGNELIHPNTEAWTDVEVVQEFRNALRSGVMNRIIMGGPEDKPITMDGVAYIPDHIARTLPYYDKMPKDSRVKGYVRFESGFLALPFTFYSFVAGALNKITGNMAAGAVRNKTAHIVVAMALGYSITKFRTPDWAWEKMDMEDKIMRSFDMSGIAALHSDLLYRTITMAHEIGFDSGFPIQPKYSGGYDPFGAAVSIGGAPADWTLEMMRSIKLMVEGDVGDGAKKFVNMLPLIETMATGDTIKDTMKDIVGQLPNRP
tara:strand:+ start:3554 stop:7144 length:3591 start_codon:yes stop_codon:yes gene_type:complete